MNPWTARRQDWQLNPMEELTRKILAAQEEWLHSIGDESELRRLVERGYTIREEWTSPKAPEWRFSVTWSLVPPEDLEAAAK